MTPKEKAIELVEKMFSLSTANAFPAKQCAIIAVDEILKAVESDWSFMEKRKEYWQKVKIEIQNL